MNDKREWDQAVRFFETSVKEKLQQTEPTISEMFGPSTTQRWLHYDYADHIDPVRHGPTMQQRTQLVQGVPVDFPLLFPLVHRGGIRAFLQRFHQPQTSFGRQLPRYAFVNERGVVFVDGQDGLFGVFLVVEDERFPCR